MQQRSSLVQAQKKYRLRHKKTHVCHFIECLQVFNSGGNKDYLSLR